MLGAIKLKNYWTFIKVSVGYMYGQNVLYIIAKVTSHVVCMLSSALVIGIVLGVWACIAINPWAYKGLCLFSWAEPDLRKKREFVSVWVWVLYPRNFYYVKNTFKLVKFIVFYYMLLVKVR